MRRIHWLQILAVVILIGYMVVPVHDPLRVHADRSFVAPGPDAWFGTDRLGRDVFSRTGRALRNTTISAGFAEVAGFLAATAISLVSAARFGMARYAGVLIDVLSAAMRAIPAFLLAFVIAVALRESAAGMPIALFSVSFAYSLPLYQADIRRSSESPFIEGAIALGAPPWYQFARLILPDVLPRLTRFAFLDFASLVAFASLFGFVGLSQPPEPNLGELIYESRTQIFDLYWVFWAPSGTLIITMLTIWSFAREEGGHGGRQ